MAALRAEGPENSRRPERRGEKTKGLGGGRSTSW